MFARVITSRFTSKLRIYKFTRYIGHRFASKCLDFKDLPGTLKTLLKGTLELTRSTLPRCCNIEEQWEGPDLFLQSEPFQNFQKFFQRMTWSQ